MQSERVMAHLPTTFQQLPLSSHSPFFTPPPAADCTALPLTRALDHAVLKIHAHNFSLTMNKLSDHSSSPPGDTSVLSIEHTKEKHVAKLSTSSPEAIRVAAEITPHRLANLLIRKGPLPIRLITLQLAVEVPGFELLSLSKQRRLIMAAMDQGDPENNVVFEKIGWGQWAVRRVDLDFIVTDADDKRINVHDLKEKAKLGWSKKNDSKTKRRDSITNTRANLHNVRVPSEPLELELDLDDLMDDDDDMSDIKAFKSSIEPKSDDLEDDDNAITEDSDEDEEDLFAFDSDDRKRLPPMKFANRVPTKFSPPPAPGRRKLSVSKSTSFSRHQLFNRSRLNSIENLDNYIVSSAKNSSLSVSSPPQQPVLVPSSLPLGSWNGSAGYLHGGFNVSPENIALAIAGGRRKSSFNESSIRSTLSSLLPKGRPYENGFNAISATSVGRRPTGLRHDIASDTDEEDWATIGAESLRKALTGALSPAKASESSQNDERTAARALVDLMSN